MRYAAAIAVVLLAGCASQVPIYGRLDGQRITGNPALTQRFETDKTICGGEMAKADVVSNAPASRRFAEGDAIMAGCMAQRGYYRAQ